VKAIPSVFEKTKSTKNISLTVSDAEGNDEFCVKSIS